MAGYRKAHESVKNPKYLQTKSIIHKTKTQVDYLKYILTFILGLLPYSPRTEGAAKRGGDTQVPTHQPLHIMRRTIPWLRRARHHMWL